MLALAAACAPAKKKTPPLPQGPTLTRTDFVTGLNRPWDMGFLANGTMFFTERVGNIWVRLPNGGKHRLTPIGPDLPDPGPNVRVEDVAGMMGLAVDPNFTTTRAIYTCFSSTDNDVRVARWTLDESHTAIVEREDIVTGIPLLIGAGRTHAGCRVRFRPGTFELLITTGDAQNPGAATDPGNLGGKVLRVDRNGDPVQGNPFGTEVYTYGHRNPQGLAFRGGASYGVEHGPGCDDEVNRLVSGGNYGWDGELGSNPGYSENVPMTDTIEYPTAVAAVWSSGCPTIAPSGATFLSGAQWKGWDGALALAALHRLEGGFIRISFLTGDQLAGEVNAIIGGAPSPMPRLRSVVQGPDGSLYIATDVPDGGGAIWRVIPT